MINFKFLQWQWLNIIMFGGTVRIRDGIYGYSNIMLGAITGVYCIANLRVPICGSTSNINKTEPQTLLMFVFCKQKTSTSYVFFFAPTTIRR